MTYHVLAVIDIDTVGTAIVTGVVPSWITDAASFIGACTIIITGTALIFTRRPARWLWKRVVSDPLGQWFQRQVAESPTGHLVAYHLGPNGETPPVHKRLAALEIVHGLEPPAAERPEEPT